jgi:hypothetical protein
VDLTPAVGEKATQQFHTKFFELTAKPGVFIGRACYRLACSHIGMAFENNMA